MRVWKQNYLLLILVFAAFVVGAVFLSRGVDTLPASAFGEGEWEGPCIVIDAGHGGEDGGAVSCTGVNESQINLEIALRLDDFLHLMGHRTLMLRTEDISLHSDGCTTISEKKVSDLKNRVRRVEEIPNALLVSIHQNQFSQSKYHGAQVFFAPTDGSEALAEQLQEALRVAVDPQNRRKCKKADSVYLMNKITCPGVLVECGFLSNPTEEAKLRDPTYQKKLAAAIGCAVSRSLEGTEYHES